MRNRLLFLALFCVLTPFLSNAQLIGTNTYLQGRYLEIGICPNGAFGAPAPPSSYHPHVCYTCTTVTPSANLAEVYDYGHDGWTVGSPSFMGDYTYPGSPFEGWEVQANGQRAQGYYNGGGTFSFSGGGTMVGSGPTAYTNTAGDKRGYWAGTTYGGNLAMRMITRVDTLASAVVVTTFFRNTSGSAIPGVYYWRSCDPDNDVTWPTGSFTTNNVINFQNATIPNPTHKVMVTATGTSGTLPPMTLCTKDCRAVAVIYGSWGLTVSQDLAAVWNQTYGGGGAFYNVGVNHPGDIGIGLVWNIGSIAAGDSAVVSYAYVFNGPAGIDDPGALPDPVLEVNGVKILTFPDTLDGCSLPGVDSVPVNILYADDKDWTWSEWTWTPSTGLSATTGTHIILRLSGVPGTITYTVSGTDSNGHMNSCNRKQFIFTVHSCHLAYANDPCVGDALHLGMLGDSLGATYFWTGPAGFTSTQHNPWIYPTIWADTGYYRVVRTIGGVPDTDMIHIILHPLPVVNATSNIPNACDPMQNPLNLYTNLDSAGETFRWTGPGGFTSTLQNPVIAPFDSSMQGTFTVTGTTIWGCKTTKSINVWPGIDPQFHPVIHYGCVWDTVWFYNYTSNATTYQWIFGDPTPDVLTRNTMHVYRANNSQWTVKLHVTNLHCDTFVTHVVDARHEIRSIFAATPDTLCFNDGANSVAFVNSSFANDSTFTGLAASQFAWNFGDGNTDNTSGPSHTFAQPGLYPVTLTVSDAMGCKDSSTVPVYVVQINIKSLHDTMLCISQPLPLYNEVSSIPEVKWDYKFAWSQSSPNLDNDTVQIPHLFGLGIFTDILTVTIPGIAPDGCPALDTMVINSVLGKKLSNLTATQTIDYGDRIQLYASNAMLYYWLPNDGSLDNNNINNPIASPKITTKYTVFGYDDNGCLDSAYITIRVDTTMNQDVPSAFTPNGDGDNDVFKPVGIKFQHLVEFRVFNRWGQEIFYTNNKEVGWDGTYHGTKQDFGVYNYLIIVAKPGQDNVVYKGNVTLIR